MKEVKNEKNNIGDCITAHRIFNILKKIDPWARLIF